MTDQQEVSAPIIPSPYHFDIHASVVFRLGDELISDEIQALVELIKNSYDADATVVRVRVSTQASPGRDSEYPNAKGFILIEDNGMGMNEKAIKNGWLTISRSEKAVMKENSQTTKRYGRSPQGDKGLGRLGTQRLGNNLEIITKPENEASEYHVGFSWLDFSSDKVLTEIPVKFEKSEAKIKNGTRLIISDLNNIGIWTDQDSINKLQTSLSRLISPFKKIRNYHIDLRVDGIPLNLAQIADELRKTAQLRYEILFKDNRFLVTGLAKLEFFNPSAEDRGLFYELVETDNGQNFLQYLMNQKKGKSFNIAPSEIQSWYIQYSLDIPFENIPKLLLDGEKPANPGEFHGEVDFFHLEEGSGRQNIFNAKADYKKYIRDLSGISIYRDGFGIRVDSDWLNLRSGATSGSSRYVLRPDNVIGYIEITSAGNPKLKETTSREGFIANPYYGNFYLLVSRFVKFSSEVQTYIRRGWLDFRNEHIKQHTELITKDTSPKALTNEIQKTLDKADTHRKNLKKTYANLQRVSTSSDKVVSSIVKDSLAETEKILTYLDGLTERASLPRVISNQFEQLQYQLAQTYETMSLGLTAEALSHEFSNVTIQLAERTEQVLRYLKQNNITDPKILSYIEYVRGSIVALRKQLSHFTPSLKYVRDKQENIDLVKFFTELSNFYDSKFSAKKIEIIIDKKNTDSFALLMSKGKITQIFDNLFLNSLYWLQEDLRLKYISTGKIYIELDKPFVRFYDNGRGIDPVIETTLFEPFVTAKSNNQGRGLGLFIINQLLESEGCQLFLLPERNEHNRLYIFELNLANRII